MNLVTGSTGIVGIRIMFDLLKSGKNVRGFKRKDSDLSVVKRVFDFYDAINSQKLFNDIEWVDGDVLDISSLDEAMMGCDYVFHCAAVVSFHPRDRKEMYKVNQIGTANVVNIAIAKGIKKLIHISSIAALGREKIGATITEKTEWSPSKYNSYYAITKFGSEREVWRGMEEGLDAVVLNPGIIIGAGKIGKSSASMFAVVKNGLMFYTKGTGSFVDVRDVSKVAIESLNRDWNKERFILVSEDLPMRDVLDRIAVTLNKSKAKFLARKWLLSVSWRAVAFKDVVFRTKSSLTHEAARAANASFNYSSSKLEDDINRESKKNKKEIIDDNIQKNTQLIPGMRRRKN